MTYLILHWSNMKYYLDFLLGVVLALLGGVDGCGLVGAGIDDGACLDELLLDISITSDDDDFLVWGGELWTLVASGLFCCSSSDDWWGAVIISLIASLTAIVRFAPVIEAFKANCEILKPVLTLLLKKLSPPSSLLLGGVFGSYSLVRYELTCVCLSFLNPFS